MSIRILLSCTFAVCETAIHRGNGRTVHALGVRPAPQKSDSKLNWRSAWVRRWLESGPELAQKKLFFYA